MILLILEKAEYIDQTLFLTMSEYIYFEDDPMPFIPALDGLEYIGDMLSIDYEGSRSFKVNITNYINFIYNIFILLYNISFNRIIVNVY